MLEQRKARIMLALSESDYGASTGYICEKCRIDETCDAVHTMPCKPLLQLERDGLVQQLEPSSWSSSNEPHYRLAVKTRDLMNNLFTARTT